MPGLLSAKDPTYDEWGQRKPHKSSTPRRIVDAPKGALSDDLNRGRYDKVFWSKRFLGIEEHPGQRRFSIAATMTLDDGYSPAFLDLAQSSGNQAGKTINLATTILHHTFYKFGLRPPNYGDPADVDRWMRNPYHWYHISHEGKVANLVHNDLRMILTGSHPAQKGRGCPLISELGEIIEWDKRDLGEYPWIRVHQAFGGGEIHFRHTNEKAKALLGIPMNGISYDEAAFELYLPEIRSEVLHLRRITTGGPIYWISTGTEGYNAFADLWEEGNRCSIPHPHPHEIPCDLRRPSRYPRSLSLRMSTRDNIGYGITQKQFDEMVANYDPRLIPQNIDGFFIESIDAYFYHDSVDKAFDPDAEPEGTPKKQHRYVQGVDLGITSDATAVVVLDYTKRPWRGVRIRQRGGRQPLPAIVNMVDEGRLLFQKDGAFCSTVVDSTGMGGKMFMQEFSAIKPLRAFDFAGTKAKKLELLADLKAAFDRGDLILPRTGTWATLRRQLLGYKLDDKKLETDLVMALALAVRHALRNPANPVDNPSFSYFGGSD